MESHFGKGDHVFTKCRLHNRAKFPDLLQNPVVKKIARKHHVTEAQVLLRHLAQSGIAVIPKSTNPSRIQLNYQVPQPRLLRNIQPTFYKERWYRFL